MKEGENPMITVHTISTFLNNNGITHEVWDDDLVSSIQRFNHSQCDQFGLGRALEQFGSNLTVEGAV